MIPVLLALACAKHPDTNMIHLMQPPEVAPAPSFSPVTPEELTLSNGARVWYSHQPGLPLVSINLVLPGGSVTDPGDAPGTTHLADSLILEGAGTRDATAFSAETDRLALDLSVETWGVASIVSLDAHTGRLQDGLSLFADAILRPHYSPTALDRVRDAAIADLKERADDPRSVSTVVKDQVYYGTDNPLAHPVSGSIRGLKAATIKSLKASWKERFAPGGATFVVVGDVDKDTMVQALEARFGEWTGKGATVQLTAPKRPSEGPQLIFVDHPGTSQTSLRVMMPAPSLGDENLVSAQLGSIVLGGTFTSRLNQLLREEKHYTYGARARISTWQSHGVLSASTAVQADMTAPALKDLLEELNRCTQGIDEGELNKARSSVKTRTIETMGSRGSIAAVYAGLAANDRPINALVESLNRAQATTIAQVQAGINTSSLSQGVVVVVGDLTVIRKPVEEAVPGKWTVVPRPE